VLAPSADTSPTSRIADAFAESFPGACLTRLMCQFSAPVSLSQRRNPLAPAQHEADEIRVLVWMLQVGTRSKGPILCGDAHQLPLVGLRISKWRTNELYVYQLALSKHGQSVAADLLSIKSGPSSRA